MSNDPTPTVPTMPATAPHAASPGTRPDRAVDVAVIGGGLAGLTAAVTAARAGASVTLLDARVVGGRARSAEREGFVLNEGPHALYESGGGKAVLDRLGVRVTGGVPRPHSYRLVWDGEIVPFPHDPRSVLASRVLGARSKLKLGGLLSTIPDHVRAHGDRTIGEWLDGEGARPDLRKYALAVLRLATYTARPERAPVWAMLGQLAVASRGGVRYVDGGWQTLVDQLARMATASGVALIDHEPVIGLERTAGRWVVSSARREVVAHSVVLAAGGPALATGLLGRDEAGWVERAGPPQRAACLDVGGRAGVVPFLLSADEPLYLSSHAPLAQLAPDGRHLVSVMRYLADDDATPAGGNRAALERHAVLAGLPPSEERSIDRFLAAPTVAWGSPQVGVERPSGHELADRGLFAAGDWTGRRLLSDASITSGHAAGAAAAERAMVAA